MPSQKVFSLDLKYKEEADLIKNGQVTTESGGVYNSAIYIFSWLNLVKAILKFSVFPKHI